MHITRVVKIINSSSNEMTYMLNGHRVWILLHQNMLHVGTVLSGQYRHYMDDTIDPELCKLAEAIGRHDSGQHKIDPANTNIQTFLKLTKCIP